MLIGSFLAACFYGDTQVLVYVRTIYHFLLLIWFLPHSQLRASYVNGAQSLVDTQDAELCSLIDSLITGIGT